MMDGNGVEVTTMGVPELFGQAEALQRAGQGGQAIALYQTWLMANDAHPLAHAVYYNLGVVFLETQDPARARSAFETTLQRQAEFYPAYINLGNALERLGLTADAAACWQLLADRLAVITRENLGYRTSALKQVARVRSMDEAENALRSGLELDPQQNEVITHWVSWRQGMCKWPVVAPFGPCDKRRLLQGLAPLSMAVHTDDPLLQLANAAMHHRAEIGQPQPVYLERHRRLSLLPPARPRIGYLTSDLRIHAIGFLMAELFECHDRSRVEIFVYALNPPAHDALKQRIHGAVEHWRDLHALTDEMAAEQIMADGIEILVDVNGYTNSARTRMLAMRPAPVIVNWLGYPGTMGSPYHHYLIADAFIIPEELEFCYSEEVVRLPCYQPNDRQRQVLGRHPERKEVGLPEGVVVYGCFNGAKKITPTTWELWMRILEQVPDSVLWLLQESENSRDRLLERAQTRGLAGRVIFAPHRPNAEHMARYPLVDLMLDSTPYGAHTTASDALWMGVPILTWAGLSFAARVCGSLVKAAGLDELVCNSAEEYVARAVELGLNPGLLAGYRARLSAGRDRCVLFDTPLLASSLEQLYFGMREDFLADRLPRPDLTSLEIYQEIGIELDGDGVWFGSVERLATAYLERLAARDRLERLPGDARLWSVEMRARYRPEIPSLARQLVALDQAEDVAGVLNSLQQPGLDPMEMLAAMGPAMDAGRVRVVYILAMLLANNGMGHAVISIGLCVGGALFGNPTELTRGMEGVVAQVAALSGAERASLGERFIRPAIHMLDSAHPLVGLLQSWLPVGR
ncbi:MAG: hypothetical protein HQL95_14110 [Magnetococcales bacterium]|nr:hypothetical protein [Magnetococcales bacterium]